MVSLKRTKPCWYTKDHQTLLFYTEVSPLRVSGSHEAIGLLETAHESLVELFGAIARSPVITVHRRVLRPLDLVKSRLVAFLERVFVTSSDQLFPERLPFHWNIARFPAKERRNRTFHFTLSRK